MFRNLTKEEYVWIISCIAAIAIGLLSFPYRYGDGDILGTLGSIITCIAGIGLIYQILQRGKKRK